MDYKALLKKYRDWISHNTAYGTDHISDTPYVDAEGHFSVDEWVELNRISQEANDD